MGAIVTANLVNVKLDIAGVASASLSV